MALPAVVLKTVYPCCKQRATFRALAGVPQERYERTCDRCGRRWQVTRTLGKIEADRRYDHLDWQVVARLAGRWAGRWAGERARTRNQQTGAVYVLVDTTSPQSGFLPGDEGEGRWVTVCDTHGTTCTHDTLALARRHLPFGEWCAECQGETK